MKRLTHKNNGIRKMMKLPDWYSCNKSTPEIWFKRWAKFTDDLMIELGFESLQDSDIMKFGRGKAWSRVLNFEHKEIGSIEITLERKRSQDGGSIIVRNTVIPTDGAVEVEINTALNNPSINNNHPYMSRVNVGNSIIDSIRYIWLKNQ